MPKNNFYQLFCREMTERVLTYGKCILSINADIHQVQERKCTGVCYYH